MDPGYISAFSALAGAAVGGLASFSTSWATQRNQFRQAHRDGERAKREALFGEFIAEASRLLGDALSHQKDDVAEMVGLYAMVGRMRLVSSRVAENVIEHIIETYRALNRTLHELRVFMQEGRMDSWSSSVSPPSGFGRWSRVWGFGHVLPDTARMTADDCFLPNEVDPIDWTGIGVT